MKPENEYTNFDELISNAIGGPKPAFDFEQWKQNHTKEIADYKKQTAGKPHKLLKYAGVILGTAAMIFLAVMLVTPNDQGVTSKVIVRDESPTFDEIKAQIEMEGIAAKVLAKANIIKQNPDRVPNAEEFVQNQYRHIVNMYSETAAAKKAAKLIN